MKFSDVVDLVALSALWGASFLFMRIAAPEFGPLVLVEVRVFIAALFLLPIFLLRADISELTSNWKKLSILSVMNSAAPFFLLTFATLSITGGFAGILNATAPIWAAMIAWVWLSDRFSLSRILGLLIGFAGVLLLVWNKVSLSFDGTTVAILAGILAAVLYAIGGNYTKKHMSGMHPLAIATGSMIAAAIILLPVAVYLWPSAMPSLRSWIAVIIMGIASTGVAYILYFRLIRNVGPAKAITVTYLIPAFAMLWGYIFIDEKVTPIMIVGCSVIFLGTALATGMLSFGRGRGF
ncbi:MAG: DMT family transporter [Gammaproteobacteria bacterium]|nr:DMT family transporter [Gammaproteobacteria bacterium]MDH5241709.1 DMT family transporter [Gammaproteobacteria bacterium]MDH5262565.1 DMT family transporter [Gammaproteobacteria bacterium]MDH5621399.1 DMT family transporter [Gammaproteobacteria bacterium]